MKYLFFALRPEQWIKNLFVFLPLIFGRKLFVFPENIDTLMGFFLLSSASSAAYLINDVIDVERDKLHPVKRLRPVPSGKLASRRAIITAVILGVAAVGLAYLLKKELALVIVMYLTGNMLYSGILKNIVIIDVFCISGFFVLRIAAGSVISDVVMSHWIVIMTALLALFLGFNKRRQEIIMLRKPAFSHQTTVAGYDEYFIDQLISVVTSSIALAYILYTVDARTVMEFGTTHLLYSVPFVYYGIFRYLYLIHIRPEDGDPTRILFSDNKMMVNLALWIVVCIGVIYFRF